MTESDSAQSRNPKVEDEPLGHHEEKASEDATSLWSVVARDVAMGAALLSLFAAADSWYLLGGGSLAAALSGLDGLLVGAGLGALCHEWGHFVGARLSGGAAPLRPFKALLPLFDFNYLTCKSEHFMGLSVGGNVSHWLLVFLLFLSLPLSTPGQAALLSGAFGFAVFASSVEFPVIRKARTGASPLESLGVIPGNFRQRNGGFGALAALLMLAIL